MNQNFQVVRKKSFLVVTPLNHQIFKPITTISGSASSHFSLRQAWRLTSDCSKTKVSGLPNHREPIFTIVKIARRTKLVWTTGSHLRFFCTVFKSSACKSLK